MKVLVTGDKGFVGSATTKLLEANGHEVIGFDLMDGLDIRDRRLLADVCDENDPDRILHLAAIARFADADADPMLAHDTNVMGSVNVASVAREGHIPVVYASTGSVLMPVKRKPPITEEFEACGNSVYGCTKYMGELYIKRVTPHIVLRYAHLYGREKRFHGLVGGFLSRIERGLAPTLYGGKQSNDFTYISDVAKANLMALEADWSKWNQVYHIGTGEELTTEEAARAICEVFGYDGQMEVKEQRTVDPDRFVFDCSKAERMLGFKADYTFRQGLEHMRDKDLAPRALHAA